MSSRLNGKPTRIGEELQVRILSVRIKLREIEVDVTRLEIEKGATMSETYVYQRDLLKAIWFLDNYDAEIESIEIGKGDGIIRFCNGEEITIKKGVKRYNAEINSEYYANDPDTYPDFVRNAFGYFDSIRSENPFANLEEIANDAANFYSENIYDHEFILECFRASYPELARECGEEIPRHA